MANIKHLQMWESICADARVSVSKSFFGLCTSVVYNPTNSEIKARTFEMAANDGERVKRILTASRDRLDQAIGDFLPKSVVNGNYKAEICASLDGAFLAVQLLQFLRMKYEPVTEVLVFEGSDARKVGQLF